MKRRLNGWQRIGIICSVLWLLGQAVSIYEGDVRQANLAYSVDFNLCLETKAKSGVECGAEAQPNLDRTFDGYWMRVAILGAAPIPFLWLFAYALIGVVQWVRLGLGA